MDGCASWAEASGAAAAETAGTAAGRMTGAAGWLAAETTTAGFSSRFNVSFMFPSSSFSSVREWSATAFTRERIS